MSFNCQTSIEFENALRQKDDAATSTLFLKVATEHGFQSLKMSELVYLLAVFNSPQERIFKNFLSENPHVIHPAQVSLAACRAETGRLDSETELARDYIRRFSNTPNFENLEAKSFQSHVLGRAYMLLTSAYTTIGARSYSIRILKTALANTISEIMRAHIENEIERLDKELRSQSYETLDELWEEFFKDGRNFVELHRRCEAERMDLLAKRLELLSGQFRFQLGYSISESEMLQQVTYTDDNRKNSVLL